MNLFNCNKIFSSVLCCLIIIMLGSFLADFIIPHHNSLPIFSTNNTLDKKKDTNIQPEDIKPFLLSANIKKGKILSRNCTQCHTFNKNGQHRLGPNLWGIVGRVIASVKEYPYSRALSKIQGKWSINELNLFLKNPRKYAKGTKMSYIGSKNIQDRANIITYLETLHD